MDVDEGDVCRRTDVDIDANMGYMVLMVMLSQSSSTTSSPYICSSMSSSVDALDAAPSVVALSWSILLVKNWLMSSCNWATFWRRSPKYCDFSVDELAWVGADWSGEEKVLVAVGDV